MPGSNIWLCRELLCWWGISFSKVPMPHARSSQFMHVYIKIVYFLRFFNCPTNIYRWHMHRVVCSNTRWTHHVGTRREVWQCIMTDHATPKLLPNPEAALLMVIIYWVFNTTTLYMTKYKLPWIAHSFTFNFSVILFPLIPVEHLQHASNRHY